MNTTAKRAEAAEIKKNSMDKKSFSALSASSTVVSSSFDETCMREALHLAERGRGFTKLNPLVGAVVARGKAIVGRGWHEYFGGPHAEINALRSAGRRARGGTLYVTLEPCSTWGKTPPCTDTISASGVKRVVVAMYDPNPVNGRRGVRLIRSAGIRVDVGLCEREARELNQFFITLMTQNRPQVILKMAESLDGKVATVTGDSRWISSPASRTYVHTLRRAVDAVMVGAGTVRRDNPELTVRLVKTMRQPARVIVDPDAGLSLSSRVFRHTRRDCVIVIAASSVSERRVSHLEHHGVVVIRVPERQGRLAMAEALAELKKLNIGTVLVEGGPTLAASLFEEQVIDRVLFVVAPLLIGGKTARSALEGVGARCIRTALQLTDVQYHLLGPDMLVEGVPSYAR